MAKQKIRWGILSTAKIGVDKVIPAMQRAEHCEIVAISSRSGDRAQKAADKLAINKAVGSYEELLELPNVDAVYNPLPNHLHVPWSIKALEAGKHVLCEKPVGLSADEAQELSSEAEKHPDLKVMEAFMYRHHPRWIKARELVKSGVLGELQTIRSFFSYYNDDPGNVRNMPDIGGGGLMDIGCYCISVSRFLYGEEPENVFGSMEFDSGLGIDRLTSGMMEFKSGTAVFTCGTQLAPHQRVQVFGAKGRMELSMPFNTPVNTPTSIHLHTGKETREISFEPCNQYTVQGELFSKAILEHKEVPTELNDALANMKVIDAVIRSNRQRAWVRL